MLLSMSLFVPIFSLIKSDPEFKTWSTAILYTKTTYKTGGRVPRSRRTSALSSSYGVNHGGTTV
jgi:hypothetical protein